MTHSQVPDTNTTGPGRTKLVRAIQDPGQRLCRQPDYANACNSLNVYDAGLADSANEKKVRRI